MSLTSTKIPSIPFICGFKNSSIKTLTKSLTPLAPAFIFRPSMKFIPLMTRGAIEKTILLYLIAHIISFIIYVVKVGQMMGFFGG